MAADELEYNAYYHMLQVYLAFLLNIYFNFLCDNQQFITTYFCTFTEQIQKTI